MDRLRSILNLVLAVGQIAVPVLLFRRGFEVDVSGPRFEPTPIVPADYAFAIWGPIFLGSLAYAIVGVLPRYLQHPLFRRIGWLTAATFAASTLWMVFARFGPLWVTLPLIVVGLATALPAFLQAARWPARERPLVSGLVVVPLALYAGWLSLAVFANVSETLQAYDVAWFTRELTLWTLVLLTLATLVAVMGILGSGGSIAFAAAVLWGLVAIVVANAGTLVAGVATAFVVVATLALVLRRVYPPRHAR